MPALVVHKSLLQDARTLLQGIGVLVDLIFVDGEREPKPSDIPRLQGQEVAFVGIRKPYVLAAERHGCKTVLRLETVRGGQKALVDWLKPATSELTESPRVAFEKAASAEPRLILADRALETADLVVPPLYPFMNRAASALKEYAALGARAPMGLERFFAERGVAFAPSGGCAFRWRVVDSSGKEIAPLTPKQHKHLKHGDYKSTPDQCARVYFGVLNRKTVVVVVARCGPHPPTDFDVTVTLAEEE